MGGAMTTRMGCILRLAICILLVKQKIFLDLLTFLLGRNTRKWEKRFQKQFYVETNVAL
jgi:hypothetical protein